MLNDMQKKFYYVTCIKYRINNVRNLTLEINPTNGLGGLVYIS